MKTLNDSALLVNNGGRQIPYYGGGGRACPTMYKIGIKIGHYWIHGSSYHARPGMTHNRHCLVR